MTPSAAEIALLPAPTELAEAVVGALIFTLGLVSLAFGALGRGARVELEPVVVDVAPA